MFHSELSGNQCLLSQLQHNFQTCQKHNLIFFHSTLHQLLQECLNILDGVLKVYNC